jgi:twitching motility protein PilU
MNIDSLLERMVKEGASDGFITADAPLSIKVDGQIYPISKRALTEDEARDMVFSTMRQDQQVDFRRHHECNYAMSTEALGRFRASALCNAVNVAWSSDVFSRSFPR